MKKFSHTFENFSEVKNDVFVTNTSEELSTHVRKAFGALSSGYFKEIKE